MATADNCWFGASAGASATLLATVTVLPLIVRTLTVLSARLVTSAKVPARLIAMPEGCLPSWSVAITAGGYAVRSMTKSLLSGTFFRLSPSLTTSIELATSASLLSGVIARLVGGPMTLLIERQGRDDARLGAVADVDDRQRVLARQGQDRLAVLEYELLVIADDQILGLRHGGASHHGGQRGRAQNSPHDSLPEPVSAG